MKSQGGSTRRAGLLPALTPVTAPLIPSQVSRIPQLGLQNLTGSGLTQGYKFFKLKLRGIEMIECDADATSRAAFEQAVSITPIDGDLDETVASNQGKQLTR